MHETPKVYDYSVADTEFHSSSLMNVIQKAKSKAKIHKRDVVITLNGKPYATLTKRLQLIAA